MTKPIDTVRLGTVQAAIWKNETANGVYYNVTFDRRYKDGDEWKSSTSFGVKDLLALRKAADMAHTKVIELQAKDKSNSRDSSPHDDEPIPGAEPVDEQNDASATSANNARRKATAKPQRTR